MATLKTLRRGIKLSVNEKVVLDYLNENLQSYFGETFSDIDCNDIAKDLGKTPKSIVGTVGSLVKKNLLATYETGTGFDVVYFADQEEMVYEKFLPTPVSTEEVECGVDKPAVFGKHNPNFDSNMTSQKPEVKKTSKVTVKDVAESPAKAVRKVFRKYNSIEDIVKVIEENGVKNLSDLNTRFYGAYDAMNRNGWKEEVLQRNILQGNSKK